MCVKDDQTCTELVERLRAQRGSEFQAAADRFEAYTGGRIYLVAGDHPRLNYDGINRNGDGEDWRGGARDAATGEIWLNADFSRGDQLITAVHESLHTVGKLDGVDEVELRHTEYRAYEQLSPSLRRGAVRHSDRFFHTRGWGGRYGRHHVIQEPQ